jgi:hypothetical protein
LNASVFVAGVAIDDWIRQRKRRNLSAESLGVRDSESLDARV